MQLFYNKELQNTSSEISFDKVESRHIVKVLRKKTGDILHITNGDGLLFNAEIILASDKKCVAQITSIEKKSKSWNYHLHMIVAPTKSMDRFEWFLEKATEIGIDEITPLFTENSERKVIKLDRIEKIVQAAAKQSLKFHFPKINQPIKLNDFPIDDQSKNTFIAHCHSEKARKPLKECNLSGDVTIFIGPEGDFSKKEVEFVERKNAISVSLGESRLRTETAGVVAVHTVSLLNQ